MHFKIVNGQCGSDAVYAERRYETTEKSEQKKKGYLYLLSIFLLNRIVKKIKKITSFTFIGPAKVKPLSNKV